MTTVREATYAFLREQGMTAVFGNPGSTELPFLEQFPEDFRYVLGLHEGSAQYAIQGLWTAAAYDVPVTFLVLRNEEYAILKWFGEIEQVTGAPGLDLPALDVASVAEGYGVPSQRIDDPGALRESLRDAIAADGPRLIEARVAPGMALG